MQRTINPPTYLAELCTFENFGMKIVSTVQLKTVEDILTKLGTNIKHYQRVCRDQEP